ncbi:MAG: transglycosylase domain-containing protein [Desulforhopalus sp.]|nr:transglycosylase domain-containing protein [Desulforhopalus sp.]
MTSPPEELNIPIDGRPRHRIFPPSRTPIRTSGDGSSRQPEDIAIDRPDQTLPGRKGEKTPKSPSRRRVGPDKPRRWWPLLLFFTFIIALACSAAIYYETQTSTLQAKYISAFAAKLNYQTAKGPSDSIVFPKKGPYDLRLGYVQLPAMAEKLKQKGMEIVSQVRVSDELRAYATYGFNIPYSEKSQAGLHILDATEQTMYRMTNPKRVYADFAAIPQPVVQALLFIENRDLLSDKYPKVNPAVDWGRFSKAVMVKTGELVNINLPSMGGSTLATQTEKFRHSDSGITSSITDKLYQMASASVRAYRGGEDTSAFRKQLVLDYVNSVPLSAAPGAGEVIGLGDGLFVWYGAEFAELNRLLQLKNATGTALEQQAKALKQVISLMIAHRRPSFYLVKGHSELALLSNSYARLLAQGGFIEPALSEAVQTQPLVFRNFSANSAAPQVEINKGVNVVRNRLSSLFDASLYDLDRMDMTVNATLNSKLQEEVSWYLKTLEMPTGAEAMGLVGKYLLAPDQAAALAYSFTLFECTPAGNVVRVQTDTTETPFDINEGSKLELGSTAKLRTLVTYLEIIAELYGEVAKLSPEQLDEFAEQRPDVLSTWVCDQLREDPMLPLRTLLRLAMERTYSANPEEQFFTGGGLHVFGNFRKEDDSRVVTVTEALQNSINLPFVRIMRDIVSATRSAQWENNRKVLVDDKDPRRKEVLDKFIDTESRVFLGRFWKKYQGQNSQERLETLLSGMHPTPLRLAIIHRHLFPKADEATFVRFIKEELPGAEAATESKLSTMYEKYKPGAYNLKDLGYLAALHPLELWLLDYLQQPGVKSQKDAMEKSAEVRREVYGWLLRTKAKNARDSRVRIVLEIDAFSDIHRRWANLGYPFEQLVPSLATALGSSGDRPAALAELIGILLNNGKRYPTHRFTRVEFAKDTPYETIVEPPPPQPQQVLNPDVARIVKETMGKVVSEGTARRLLNSFQQADGSPLPIGGKTGTGDNRIFSSGTAGAKTSSKALNRTATFVFYLGDRHFGVLTAFVSGKSATAFSFTSALPLQVLKGMVPVILPYINETNKQNQIGQVGFPIKPSRPDSANQSSLPLKWPPR